MDPFELRRTVRALVEPTIDRMGFDLVAVEWSGDGAGRILRLSVDSARGIGADDCARISHQVSPLLDAADPVSGSYRLEVSSPGIERPVERPEDFRRFTGYRAKLVLFPGHPRRRYTGTLDGVDDHELGIVVDGQEHRIDLESIEKAHLVLTIDEYQALPDVLYGANAQKEGSP